MVCRRGTLFRPAAGNAMPIEQALVKSKVDVLLTAIDAPSVRTNLPKLLFALDMLVPGSTVGKNKLHPVLPRAVKRNCADARLIICPSAYMQKTCSTCAEVGLEKTVLARAGVEMSFSKEHTTIIDGPYMLFPMNRYSSPYIGTVTEAIKRNPGLFSPTLVIMGPIYKKEPADWGVPIIRVEKCPDDIMSNLLQNADAVLYPAQGDGSGMLALQALRSGATLLTSKSGAHYEVGGTVPFYFEADNPISMLQIMRRMLDESPEEKERRRQTGRTLVTDCTWEKCTSKIISAIKRGML
jgi:glycosyltransferase involved in cell wall biosynthesis